MAKADEPAFPDPHYEGSTVTGLTKREYFAAMALQGILASPNFSVTYKDAAHEATHYADALLASLEPLEF